MKAQTFAIGSLPFQNIDQAVTFHGRADIFTVPSLPQISADELMIQQALKGITKRTAGPSFSDFGMALSSSVQYALTHNIKTLKYQIASPYLLALYQQESDYVLEEIKSFIEIKVRFLEHYLSSLGLKLLLFFDCPHWGQQSVNLVAEELQWYSRFNFTWGIHCCSDAPWEVVVSNTQVLSLDAFISLDSLLRTRQDFSHLILGLGIWDTSPKSLGRIFNIDQWRANLLSFKTLWVSPSCGLAGSPVELLQDNFWEKLKAYVL